ncbi:unnamed protein product [Anisakis simplex]|nr:unnamed protein product [Anisakis simplex]
MASLSFGSSLVDYLSEKYAHLAQNISSNRRLQIEIQSELNK